MLYLGLLRVDSPDLSVLDLSFKNNNNVNKSNDDIIESDSTQSQNIIITNESIEGIEEAIKALEFQYSKLQQKVCI